MCYNIAGTITETVAMTDLAFTTEQTAEANEIYEQVRSLIAANQQHQVGLESNFVEIGIRLAAIKANRYWKMWKFQNFSSFMLSLDSRSKNYASMGVALDLLPVVPKENLVAIGIGKAALLRQLMRHGKRLSEELLAEARSLTKEQLEGRVAQELGLVKEEKSPWFAFGGANLSPEESAEFLRTVNLVVRVAELGGPEIVNWQDEPPNRKKQIVHLLCAEFLATYQE
jgi:hypothetical protein